jgi:signal transduction histidine kinase
VAAAYVVISVAVVAFVAGSLTAQVDDRLASTLDHFSSAPWPVGRLPDRPPGDRPLGPTRAFWGIRPDGEVLTDVEDLPLPVEHHDVTGPTTVTIAGFDIRIAGKASGPNHIVVGESLDPVNDARSTIILGELLIAPVLLLVVFLGAIAIGRRVAAPIEDARRRQLDFTADASHELRTPLSVIEANASLALAQMRDRAWYRAAFEKVDAEAKRMRRLLDDMLWLARFDASQRPALAEPVDLGVLAEHAAERFAPVAEARRLSLTVRADPAGTIVSAPPEWLDRLLGVLLDNACKYSPDGGSVSVHVATTGPRVALTVDDTGPGIPSDQRDRIFDRFHRAIDGPTGAGLGLAIADAIVMASGGRWSVGDSPAGGARMTVSWPRGDVRAGREAVGMPDRTSVASRD